MATYRLTYPSVSESEDRAYDDVVDLLTRHGVDTDSIHAFCLIVSEALVNALTHGNRLDPGKMVELVLSINDETITADIVDQGCGGMERIGRRAAPELLAESGRGIDLMNHYAANMRFAETDEGGLRVSLVLNRRQRKVHS